MPRSECWWIDQASQHRAGGGLDYPLTPRWLQTEGRAACSRQSLLRPPSSQWPQRLACPGPLGGHKLQWSRLGGRGQQGGPRGQQTSHHHIHQLQGARSQSHPVRMEAGPGKGSSPQAPPGPRQWGWTAGGHSAWGEDGGGLGTPNWGWSWALGVPLPRPTAHLTKWGRRGARDVAGWGPRLAVGRWLQARWGPLVLRHPAKHPSGA